MQLGLMLRGEGGKGNGNRGGDCLKGRESQPIVGDETETIFFKFFSNLERGTKSGLFLWEIDHRSLLNILSSYPLGDQLLLL